MLGPTLWNVIYYGVVRMKVAKGASKIAFAEDLAILIQTGNEETLMFHTHETLRRIDVWMRRQNLDLAPGKRDQEKKTHTFRHSENGNKTSENNKILRHHIRRKTHIRSPYHIVANEADNLVAALTQITMPNFKSPSSKKSNDAL